MARVKIVKKKRNTFNRFESDRHKRMDVSTFSFYRFIREAGEETEVSIVESEESGEEPSELPRLVMDQTTRPDTYSPTTN